MFAIRERFDVGSPALGVEGVWETAFDVEAVEELGLARPIYESARCEYRVPISMVSAPSRACSGHQHERLRSE
jgi:hypothetical protein